MRDAQLQWSAPFIAAAIMASLAVALVPHISFVHLILDSGTGILGSLGALITWLRVKSGPVSSHERFAWWFVFALFLLVAIGELCEPLTEASEARLRIDDLDDLLLLVLAPLAFWLFAEFKVASGLSPRWILAGFALQALATVLDLLDAPGRTTLPDQGRIGMFADFAQFLSVWCYVGALAWRPARPIRRKARLALNYVAWRLSHPTTPYEHYYVHRVRTRIQSGGGHPAIGPAARPLRKHTELLDFLRKHGLASGDLTVDYGCGSLRLAGPLIAFLEPDRYWGMDLAQEFLDMGRDALGPGVLHAKRPRLDVIAGETIQRARAERPRFIISWHVCSKVPANRLDAYIGNIVGMMTPGATALVHFPESAELRKQTSLAWARPRTDIAAAVSRANPQIVCTFDAVVDGEVEGIRQTYAILKW